MATQGEIRLLARITALEYLMQHVLLMVASTHADPVAEIEAYRERVRADLESATIRGFDPATSDLLAQELSEAVDRLFDSLMKRLD